MKFFVKDLIKTTERDKPISVAWWGSNWRHLRNLLRRKAQEAIRKTDQVFRVSLCGIHRIDCAVSDAVVHRRQPCCIRIAYPRNLWALSVALNRQ